MISVPAVKGWGDVHSAINERCVQSNREREVAKRDIAERERERKGIEGAGSQTSKTHSRDGQAVIMNKRQKNRDERKHRCGRQQNPTWRNQAAEVHGEWPDEH